MGLTLGQRISRIIAKEGLIILLVTALFYFVNLYLLEKVPVILPKYRLEFADGRVHEIIIHPQVLNDSNYKRILQESCNPPLELVEKRVKEFIRAGKIKSPLARKYCLNSRQLFASGLYSRIVSMPFVLKITFIYLILLLIRFIFWSAKVLKRG